MPRSRQFSGGFSRGRPRRKTTWSLGPGGDDLLSMDTIGFSASGQFILGSGVAPVVPELTIVRIRGYLEVGLRTADAALAGYNYVAGIGIVSGDAFSVGVTAVPKPFDDIDWPGWLWIHMSGLHAPAGALASSSADAQTTREVVVIDTKAMRKLGTNEVLFMIVQAAETGAATMDIRGGTRVLVKLP